MVGRPAFKPTDEQRKTVEMMAAFGIPLDNMVHLVLSKNGTPVTVKTLRKHFAYELETGKTKVIANVAGKLYKEAMGGNVTAMIFLLKTRGGWAERMELTGKDGAPIEQRAVSKDEVKAAVERLNEEY